MEDQVAARVRVGIVGASPDRGWGVGAHLPALAYLDEFEVTAVATTRRASAEQTASAFGVPHAFTDAYALATHPEVDLVVVSVKAPAHSEVIRAAASAGKHVFSEWPLGVDLAEATELARVAGATGAVHAICLQGYHSPSARFVRDLLAEGRIGRLESVSAVTPGDPLGGNQIPQGLEWSLDPGAGNTLLTIMAGHVLATLDHLVGPLVEVSAAVADLNPQVVVAGTGERTANGAPSQVALHGGLNGGAVVSVSVPGGNAPGPDGFHLRLTGTDGSLTITRAEESGFLHWAEWRVHTTGNDGTGIDLAIPDRYRDIPAGVPSGPPANVAATYREIARAIAEGRPAYPGFDTAVRHHRLLDAIAQASRTGTRQPVTRD